MTHERTFQTMKLAGLLTLGVVAGFCTFGCSSPTAPTNDHPKEIRIIGLTDCYDKNLDVKVSFFDEKKPEFKLWQKKDEKIKIDPSEIIYEGSLYKVDRNSNNVK